MEIEGFYGTPEENFLLIHHQLIDALRRAGHRPQPRTFQTEYGPDLKLYCASCNKKWPGAVFHRFFGLSPRRECGR